MVSVLCPVLRHSQQLPILLAAMGSSSAVEVEHVWAKVCYASERSCSTVVGW